MPRLSVIVTTYNIERYVGQAIASVAAQTIEDLEIIVVDDGSSDRTPEIIQSAASRDARIVPILLSQNSPGGVATAANVGLDAASAPYVGFMDGDDFCKPTMFQRLLDAAEAGGTDLAMCQYRLLDEGSGEYSWPADHERWSALPTGSIDFDPKSREQLLRFVAVPWRKLYRRSLLDSKKIRFPEGDFFFEDNPFHWFAILSAASIAFVPEPLCTHRVQRSGQTMSSGDARLLAMFEHHDIIAEWLVSEGLYAQYSGALIIWAVSQMEWISERIPRALLPEFVEKARAALRPYSRAQVDLALSSRGKGPRARALAAAVMSEDVAAVAMILDRWGRNSNVIVTSAYYLRYASIREAMLRARESLSNRRTARPPTAPRRSIEHAIHNRDILFALMLLEHRLDRIEVQLAALNVDREQPTREFVIGQGDSSSRSADNLS